MEAIMRQQKGITLTGFIMVCVLVGFFGMVAMRLTPIYLRYMSVRQSMNSLTQQEFWTEGQMLNEFEVKTQIRKAFDRFLEVNEVRNLTARDLEIKRKRGEGFEVAISYDEKTPLFFNIELLVHFDKKVLIAK